MSSGVRLFVRAMLARAYPRVVAIRRAPSWVAQETLLPLLSVAALALSYEAMGAPREYVGFVVLGGAMTAFWLNVLWAMGAQLYYERDTGNLELFVMAPAPMMAILAGMALGGMVLTFARAAVIFAAGALILRAPFHPHNWPALVAVFVLMLVSLYGLGMVFASAFMLWGREAWHAVNLLQEPVYLLSGQNYPVATLPRWLAGIAALVPLTVGMDALRQLLFRDVIVFLPWPIEVAMLAVLTVLFLALARRCLRVLEDKARRDGRLTVRWQ